MDEIRLEQTKNGVTVFAKIVPGSSKTSIAGILGGMIKIKIASPPEKGKANKELISFLSKKLGLRKNDISIVSGETNPVKQIQIIGVDKSQIQNLVVNIGVTK